eukprot:290132-Prymnesium_polylepis.1
MQKGRETKAFIVKVARDIHAYGTSKIVHDAMGPGADADSGSQGPPPNAAKMPLGASVPAGPASTHIRGVAGSAGAG